MTTALPILVRCDFWRCSLTAQACAARHDQPPPGKGASDKYSHCRECQTGAERAARLAAVPRPAATREEEQMHVHEENDQRRCAFPGCTNPPRPSNRAPAIYCEEHATESARKEILRRRANEGRSFPGLSFPGQGGPAEPEPSPPASAPVEAPAAPPETSPPTETKGLRELLDAANAWAKELEQQRDGLRQSLAEEQRNHRLITEGHTKEITAFCRENNEQRGQIASLGTRLAEEERGHRATLDIAQELRSRVAELEALLGTEAEEYRKTQAGLLAECYRLHVLVGAAKEAKSLERLGGLGLRPAKAELPPPASLPLAYALDVWQLIDDRFTAEASK